MTQPRFAKVVVIVNPGAGKGEDILRPLNDVLHPAGVRWDVSITNSPGDATELARRAVVEGADLVGVVGGDGTVAEVAAGLADTGVPMAILPGGTGNGAAGEFGIPATIAAAAALLADPDAVVRPTDLGTAGDRYFLLRCACGAIAEVDRRATRELKSQVGGLAYVVSGLSTLGDITPVDYRISCDGERFEARGITCIVANGAGFGGFGSLGEGVSTADGLLDVFVYTGEAIADPGKALGQLPAVVAARALPTPATCRGRSIAVETSRPQAIVADGEPAGDTPMSVEVLPQALRLLVPAATEAGGEQAEGGQAAGHDGAAPDPA